MSNDFNQVKSVLTALGYSCKDTIAKYKTKAKVAELERKYMQIRTNVQLFNSMCVRFPKLNDIECFTPGLEEFIIEIAKHINNGNKTMECENPNLVAEKIFQQSKKVSILKDYYLNLLTHSYIFYFLGLCNIESR